MKVLLTHVVAKPISTGAVIQVLDYQGKIRVLLTNAEEFLGESAEPTPEPKPTPPKPLIPLVTRQPIPEESTPWPILQKATASPEEVVTTEKLATHTITFQLPRKRRKDAAPPPPPLSPGVQKVLNGSQRVHKSHRHALGVVERHLRNAGSAGMTIRDMATAEYGLEMGRERRTSLTYAAERFMAFDLALRDGFKWYWMEKQ